MTWDPDDFYEDTSAFDQQIDEFKQSLLKVVKTDFITKMEQLLKENAELQVVKKNLDQIKRDYKNKERQLENERNDMKRLAYRERLSVLMKDFEVLMFRATSRTEQLPKCDLCDEKRKVHFKSPLGKDVHEMCTCSVGRTVYVPEEVYCTEFRISNDNNEMLMWYKVKRDRDYDSASHDSSNLAKAVYKDGMKFEELDKWHYSNYFKSKEECQKYCEWLTERKEPV